MYNKNIESLTLSEEIISLIEDNNSSLERIAIKILKLVRLIEDNEGIKRINLELTGYESTNPLIQTIDNFEQISYTYRGIIIQDTDINGNNKYLYYDKSISQLELLNYNLEEINNNLSYEDYEKKENVIKQIISYRSLFSRIRTNMMNKVITIYENIKYNNKIENLFENKKLFVINYFSNNEDYNNIIKSINNNLESTNGNDWTNAVHNCRKLFQILADNIRPVDNTRLTKHIGTGKNQKPIKLGKENYINRLIDYIEEKGDSNTNINIIGSNLSYIGERIDSIYNSSNKGTHSIKISKSDSERYVIYTYLLIADILELC